MTELHEYQKEVVGSRTDRILIGGRQIGKTTAVISDTVDRFEHDERVGVIVPTRRDIDRLKNLIAERVENAYVRDSSIESRAVVGGWIEFFSGSQLQQEMPENPTTWRLRDEFSDDPDAFVVDEANEIDERILFLLERSSAAVLLTATPRPKRTIVETWAKNSPFWKTVQVSAEDAPHITTTRLRDFDEQLTNEQSLREVDGFMDY